MRFHKPIGAYLLLLPCLWGLSLGNTSPSFGHFALYILGAFVMRSAGCIMNDLADIEFDKKVERTNSRPLASGTLSKPKAFILLGILLSLGFLILMQLPQRVILVGALSLILVVFYPFMKRITYWPQLFLGFTFNYGAILGYLTYHPHIPASVICLYVAGIFWTLGYDTIYAYQDIKDDLKIGVKSTAILFGTQGIKIIGLFYLLVLVFLGISGFLEHKSYLFYIFLNLGAIQLVWQITTLNLKNPEDCNQKFFSNTLFGLLIFLGLYLG